MHTNYKLHKIKKKEAKTRLKNRTKNLLKVTRHLSSVYISNIKKSKIYI